MIIRQIIEISRVRTVIANQVAKSGRIDTAIHSSIIDGDLREFAGLLPDKFGNEIAGKLIS